MTTLRRILTTAALAALACGMASANSIGYLDSQGTVSFTTDGNYTLTLPDFNTDGGLYTLSSATLYFYAEEDVSSMALSNAALGQETFNIYEDSNVTRNGANTASSADKYTGEIFDVIDTGLGPGLAQANENFSGPITLGGTGSTPTCPEYTPSASCNSVLFVPPDILIQNIDAVYSLPVGTGSQGLTGVVKNITGGDLCNYTLGCSVTAPGTFNLTGGTLTAQTSNGGGGNVTLGLATSANFEGEIDYTYSITSTTPEPTTMALLGGALLGLGLIGKRFKKS
jgi:hypothetical protein